MAPDINTVNIHSTNNQKTVDSNNTITPIVLDQYADGKAAKSWKNYVGGQNKRTAAYKDLLVPLLKRYNVHSILDVACGTG